MDTNRSEHAPEVLTEADITEFIEIYEKEFKQKISRADAREMARGVVELYSVLMHPLPDK